MLSGFAPDVSGTTCEVAESACVPFALLSSAPSDTKRDVDRSDKRDVDRSDLRWELSSLEREEFRDELSRICEFRGF